MPKREMSQLELEAALENVAQQVGNGPRSQIVGWVVFFVDKIVDAMKSPYEGKIELLRETWKEVVHYVRKEEKYIL